MIEQTQAQQTQAQAPKRPASSVPLLVGGAFFAGIAAFLGWGVWEATHPAPVPLQGMVDARTISVSAKVPGRLAELKVREGDVLKAGDTVAVIAIPEIEAKLVQVKAQERAAQAREDLANTGARVQEKDAARADWERAKAALTLASKTYERVDALYREGLIPAQRHDEATAQLAAARKVTEAAAAKLSAVDEGARVEDKTAAKALVDQARGGVSEVSSLASESIVKAPAAGEVTRIVMEEGEVAPAGFPLVLVTDLRQVGRLQHPRGRASGRRGGHGPQGLHPRRQPHGRPQGQLDQSSRRVRSLACDASVDGLRPAHVRGARSSRRRASRPASWHDRHRRALSGTP